jgi:acetylornithine/succinyldiaminopimelate/putrescine aminotransferase
MEAQLASRYERIHRPGRRVRRAQLPSVGCRYCGRGLWIGIELNTQARKYCDALKEEGVLCKETHGTTIRIAPPLVIEREEIDWAFERIEKVLE